MTDEHAPHASHCPVSLPLRDLRAMIRLVRSLYRLSRLPGYAEAVSAQLPAVARFDPGHASVMMGYDFHLTEEGPRLIEVNTNAGGAMLAWQAQHPHGEAVPQPNQRPVAAVMATFDREMAAFSRHTQTQLRSVAIIDEQPDQQFLYREMVRFAELFRARGIPAQVVDPGSLQGGAEGISLAGEPIDLVYNRHCDFYLQSDAMAPLRTAYLASRVCLTPNPRTYGLLADKRRLLLWCNEAALATLGVEPEDRKRIATHVPPCHLLADMDVESFWQTRKLWVVKPVDAFGSRGVMMGKGMSRTRLAALPPETTLVQRAIPPSTTPCPWGGPPMKTDFRLFVYRDRVLGVTARIYQGQVTSFSAPGSGYAPVRLVDG